MWKLFSFEDKRITRVQVKANPVENRSGHALANYEDKFILATGGSISRVFASETAEVYSVAGNRWSPLPDMNVSRGRHGSCAVANYVYVACGENNSNYG